MSDFKMYMIMGGMLLAIILIVLTPITLYKLAKGENKTELGIVWIFIIVFSFIFFPIMLFMTPKNSNSSKPKTQEAIRKDKIEKHFSAWDGSHSELTKIIKKSMNDPDSYKHVKTSYWDKGEYLIVQTTFRGKNAFGGVVKNTIKAKVDLEGNVIEVISQSP